MDLSGKTVLVTGASSGIGRAVVIRAAGLGARLILTGRRAEALEETRHLAALSSDDCRIIPGDLTEGDFIPRLVNSAVESAPLDCLVHAAGVCPIVPISALSAKSARGAMEINCFAFLDLIGGLVRSRRLSDRFAAVAVSSVSARDGWAGGAAYCASKGALSSAVRAIETEFRPRGWRMTAIEPGPVATPMRERLAAFGATDIPAVSPQSVAKTVCSYLIG